jgi:tetratricopeptide (TPR) repeat protein/tRNA A-37 threonylcarbamoyl transferase component Bud32
MQSDASEKRLSKYEILRPLGSGGMGDVYLARDTVLRRQVAIKFVSAARLGDPDANARLLREARAAATLDHPGICPVYDVHVDDSGRTCIVMQYVEGETLAQRLTRGVMEPGEALALGARIADALAAAHARGVIHRDLKPQNVIITIDGRPKLLDFGIAQTRLSAEAIASIVTHTETSARTQGAIGTPAYMSPEQVLQKPADGRSDLFSLGAVLFECLTGQPAFLAATDVETWARVVYATAPPPSELNARVTPAADHAVATLLAKDPAARYGDAIEAARALRAAATVGDRLAAGPNRRRALATASIVTVLALGGILAWRAARPLPPAPPEARLWYDRGTDHLRNGAYFSAKIALQQAIGLYPGYAAAMTRLAEAQSQLDEEGDARATLVRLSDAVPDSSRLSREDAQRLEAIRALVLRDVARAANEYQQVAEAKPGDVGVWLDLARVQQLAGLRGEARRACERALMLPLGRQSAAVHLRLGAIASDEVRRDDALREFGEAQRLYALARDAEGEAEALLLKARFLDAIGEFAASNQALDGATAILASNPNPYQQVRASLLRSSLIASLSGDAEKARRTAEESVDAARQNGLETTAADALVEAGTALMRLGLNDAARDRLQKALDLATRTGARRIGARAALQLASFYLSIDQPADARKLAAGVLDFVRSAQYRRFELIALSIIARSEEGTDIRQAEQMSRQVLSVAESLHDDVEVAVALEGLASISAVLGSIPEALILRRRLEQLHRDQHDTESLAFDLTNRADLLIRLGRFDEADAPLQELDAGAASGVRAFAGRARRVAYQRALASCERREFATASRYAAAVLRSALAPKTPDTMQAFAEAFITLGDAARRPAPAVRRPWSAINPSGITRELRYWRGTALLATGDVAGARAEVDAALVDIDRRPSAEFEWRMAAIAAAAARRQGAAAAADRAAARARGALATLRAAWKDDSATYERRPDIIELKRAAGVS